jgi:hypothetical protein
MDKPRFLEVAPLYYAIAIREFFTNPPTFGTAASKEALRKAFTIESDGDPDGYCYLEHDALLSRAIEWLIEHRMIGVINDDFGPPILLEKEKADVEWDALQEKGGTYARYLLAPDKKAWLRSALSRVNVEYVSLGIEASDFERSDFGWEPIPLERNNSELQEVIRAVDATIELVRSDNGYSATLPEEKAHVLGGLSVLSKTLKEAHATSWPFVKTYGLEPLGRLSKRFGNAAIGVSATLCLDIIFTWLKNVGMHGLDTLWKSLF